MDAVAEAILAAKWSEPVEARRLEITRLHFVDGLPIMAIATALQITEHAVTERQVWRDWAAIRRLLRAMAAPELAEIREKCRSRYEYIYRRALADGDLKAAIRAVDRIAQLAGVMDSPQAARVNLQVQLEWQAPLGVAEDAPTNGTDADADV